MPWFLKRSGLHRREDPRWQLRLRLTRWRHFLAAETACFDLLADLREKLSGDYIFDRQYIYSTLGQLFQSAYQAAHDRGILAESDDAAMFLWLDRLKENVYAQAAVSSGQNGEEAGSQSSGVQTGPGAVDQEEWEEEPEYRMITRVLDLLDPQAGAAQGSLTPEHGDLPSFRTGLRQAHEQALQNLMKLECLRGGPGAGMAVCCGEARPFILWAIDMRSETDRPEAGGPDRDPTACGILHSTPWLRLREGMAAAADSIPRDVPPEPLLLAAGENALFLSGSIAGGRLILDVVLTSIRELNHLFLRWESDSVGSRPCHGLAEFFDPRRRERNGICQSVRFHQAGDEIALQLRRLGEVLTGQAAGNGAGDLPGGAR